MPAAIWKKKWGRVEGQAGQCFSLMVRWLTLTLTLLTLLTHTCWLILSCSAVPNRLEFLSFSHLIATLVFLFKVQNNNYNTPSLFFRDTSFWHHLAFALLPPLHVLPSHSLPEVLLQVSMWHVPNDDQHRRGATHHLQQTHHVGVAAKLGQQLRLPKKAFACLLICIVCRTMCKCAKLLWSSGSSCLPHP